MENEADPASDKQSFSDAALPAVLPPREISATLIGGVDADDIAGSFASSTKRAYAADWRDWSAWCRANEATPLPADPVRVAEYLKASAGRVAVVTLRRRLAALSQAHRIAGVVFDRTHRSIHFAMRRLARELGTAPRRARDELMTADLEALLRQVPADSLQGMRDRALLLLGFAGGLRRSELAAIDAEHLSWKRDGLVILLPRSKGDQEGAGQEVGILYARREGMCPVRALKRWMDATEIASGPVFRRVAGTTVGARASDKSVWRAVKRYAKAAGYDVEKLGAHSLRVGHVTQALANGADAVKAKEQLRHKRIDTTLGYNRRASVLKENTSGKLGL